ncbi:MAG: thioredoxin family protein [Elusimicrobiaceae bacterium]|nr:thioredoxin family protein [Elusimicrobiaceae bacterium]
MKKHIFGLAGAGLLLVGAFYLVPAQEKLPDLPVLTEKGYNAVGKKDVFVMLVGKDSCRPCLVAKKYLVPLLLERYKGNQHVHVVKVDIGEVDAFEREFVRVFEVKVTPTLFVVQDGQVLWGQEGFDKEETDAVLKDIADAVNEALKAI